MRRLVLDLRPELCHLLPDLSLERLRVHRGGNRHAEASQRFLVHILQDCFSGQRESEGADVTLHLPARLVEVGLHRSGNGASARRMLEPFFDVDFVVPPRGGARRYMFRMRPEVAAAIEAVLSTDTPAPAFVEYRRWNDVVDFAALPSNPVPPPMNKGQRLRNVIPVPLTTIQDALTTASHRLHQVGIAPRFDNDRETLVHLRRTLLACRKWAVSVGGIPNLYALGFGGQVNPVGLHMVTLPRTVRSWLLADSGLVEYRLPNLPDTLLEVAADSFGLYTPDLSAHVRDVVRSFPDWPEFMDAASAPLLARMTAAATGATQRGRTKGAVMPLDHERETVLKRLVSITMNGWEGDHRTRYLNEVGEFFRPKKGEEARQLHHIFTGFVQWAVRMATTQATGVIALFPDGFIAEPGDPERWSDALAEESKRTLGVNLRVPIKGWPFRGFPSEAASASVSGTTQVTKSSQGQTSRDSFGGCVVRWANPMVGFRWDGP